MNIVSNILNSPARVLKWFSKRSLAVKIALLAAVLGTGWFAFSRLTAGDQQPQYQTAKAEKGTIVSTVSASGNVLTSNIINISTEASGVVKAVYVKDGDKVIAGQKIAEINLDKEGQQKNASAWSSYLTAKNNLDSANINLYTLQSDMFSKWDIFKELAESSTYQNSDGSPRYEQRALPEFHIAEKNWLAAEAKYKNQQAVINQAEAALQSAWLSYQSTSPIVTAPIAGVVSNMEVVPGMVLLSQTNPTNQTTTSSQRIAVIQNEASPIISVNITEIDVPKVKIGQKVTVTLDSLLNKTFTGKVVTVDRIGTTSNNVTNYRSLIQLDTSSSKILPNMAANANIIIETKPDVLIIPSAAIHTRAGQSFVRVLRNGRQQQIPVEVGLQGDTQTEITSGLSEDDEVIIGTIMTQAQQDGESVFGGGGFGGGGFRPGGFSNGQPR
jgi:multidrug efflux pump subunit AcrA (membrane-fusion protein)